MNMPSATMNITTCDVKAGSSRGEDDLSLDPSASSRQLSVVCILTSLKVPYDSARRSTPGLAVAPAVAINGVSTLALYSDGKDAESGWKSGWVSSKRIAPPMMLIKSRPAQKRLGSKKGYFANSPSGEKIEGNPSAGFASRPPTAKNSRH